MPTYTTPVASERMGHGMQTEASIRNRLEMSRVLRDAAQVMEKFEALTVAEGFADDKSQEESRAN